MLEKITLGTAQWGMNYGINNSSGEMSLDEVTKVMDYAFENNIHTLDTANAYGRAIDKIAYYHNTRKRIFNIHNKFYKYFDNIDKRIDNELKHLGINHFEVYYFHHFNDFQYCPIYVHDALWELKAKGKIKKIGVAVYDNEEVIKVADCKWIDVIQMPYNLLDNFSLRGDAMKYANEKEKEIHIRSVFLQGIFFMNETKVTGKLKELFKYINQIKQIASDYDISMLELCLLYPFSNPYIQKIIMGIDSLEQLKININVLTTKKSLPASLIRSIEQIHIEENALLKPYNWQII
ncbi:MAG: aldo/keto reductase [Bacteroidia bacterium]|nr:aldo/keto reductase [Bacteroidia bacterium]